MGQGGANAGGSFSATGVSATLNGNNSLGATSAVGRFALERNLYGKV